MAKKDPAFLFYPKDWLQGTAELMPKEKGVYIDLLAHQHQDKDLPNNTKLLARMVGLSESEFLKVWKIVKHKFRLNSNKRLYNQKLFEVTIERATKATTNHIVGTFASIIRLSTLPFKVKQDLKKSFKAEMFLAVPREILTVQLTNWLTNWLTNREKTIGDENINENINENTSLINNSITTEYTCNLEIVPEVKIPPIEDINLELPEKYVKMGQEYFSVAKKNDRVSPYTIERLWEIFKGKEFNGTRTYKTVNDIFNHFINSLKFQTLEIASPGKRSMGRDIEFDRP